MFGIYAAYTSVSATVHQWGLKPWLVAVLALVFPVAGCAGQSATGGETAQGSFRVVRVVDGDTFIAEHDGKHRIRVLGIDTPETVDPNRPVECGGEAASKAARKLLDGRTVELETDASQGVMDKYDRMLPYVRLPNGRDFGKTMIADGHAREFTYKVAYRRQDAYRAAERVAKAKAKGIWGSCYE